MIGTGEVILIIVAILIIFGAKKIPELSKSIGKAIKNLKAGMKKATIFESLYDF